MLWTGWALDTLREAVEIDMRCKRLTAQQQSTTLSGPKEPPDFGLIQSRLSRSVRLSIAMTERIRADYLMRREKRTESGEEQRRQQRREQAAEAVVKAVATPQDGEGAEHLRSVVRETLVEDEILDVQLDTLSPEEFLQAVCRKIGRPPHPIRLPHGLDEVVETEAEPAEAGDRVPAEGWPEAPDESAAGRPVPEPAKPDSS